MTTTKIIKIGSLFSGIGGFELGFERAISNSETVWQCEQDKYCQKVLKKHWPNSIIYDDVKNINKNNVQSVDVLLGGFPCQDISASGRGEGINGKRSGLWWEMHRIIGELQPTIAIMENVPAITFRGLDSVLGSLAQIGYDAEWTVISARQFGASHIRKRWFCVAYPHGFRQQAKRRYDQPMPSKKNQDWKTGPFEHFFSEGQTVPYLCRNHDGISPRLDKDRLKSLGNAIVPQCSQYIAECIKESGLLELIK